MASPHVAAGTHAYLNLRGYFAVVLWGMRGLNAVFASFEYGVQAISQAAPIPPGPFALSMIICGLYDTSCTVWTSLRFEHYFYVRHK